MSVQIKWLLARDAAALRASTAVTARRCASLAYLEEILVRGVGPLVTNAQNTRMELLTVDDEILPLLINDGAGDDCYLAAPHSHYVRYLRHEVGRVTQTRATRALSGAIGAVGVVASLGRVNRCVSVNNWLFSTNPTVVLSDQQLVAVVAALRDRFPTHALVFRSVAAENLAFIDRLRRAGFQLIINRPVHHWDPKDFSQLHPGKRGNVRRDIRALEKGDLEVGGRDSLRVDDAPRLAELYQKLYLIKHVRLNAAFSAAYFATLIETAAVEMFVLRDAGNLVGFVAYYIDHDAIVPTIIGYDTNTDVRQQGLYRALMALLFRMALTSGQHLFLSTGASSFKLNRGSTESIEYEAIFDQHLSVGRRFSWFLLRKTMGLAMNTIETEEI